MFRENALRSASLIPAAIPNQRAPKSRRDSPAAAGASFALDCENQWDAHAESDFPPAAVTRFEFPPGNRARRRLDEFPIAGPPDDLD
jgi:hypothetical protein